jgi:hypothetical protein
MRKLPLFVLFFLLAGTLSAGTIYTDRSLFVGALGTSLTDSYSPADGYPVGFASLSNAAMSAVFGETQYLTTGHSNANYILSDETYCAGCNGSFQLDFRATSIGTAQGVFGAGVDILANSPSLPYYAYVSFGNGTTGNYALPSDISFFGITSPDLISTIHFGLSGGNPTTGGSFKIDNLTIGTFGDGNGNGNGTVVIPEPSLTVIVGLALIGLALRRRQ